MTFKINEKKNILMAKDEQIMQYGQWSNKLRSNIGQV